MNRFIHSALIGLVCIGALSAQEGGGAGFTFEAGGGYTITVGNTARNLNNEGWNMAGGFGYNFSPRVGAKIDLAYNQLGINGAALSNLGTFDGSFSEFSATLDPIVHLNPGGHLDFYLTGGGGLFHQHQGFGSLGAIAGYNPFFGYYASAGPSQTLSPYSVNRPGIDAGAGLELGTRYHGKIFMEAKYDRVFLGNYHVDFIPVTFGFRWK